jgi:hypothetical protein
VSAAQSLLQAITLRMLHASAPDESAMACLVAEGRAVTLDSAVSRWRLAIGDRVRLVPEEPAGARPVDASVEHSDAASGLAQLRIEGPPLAVEPFATATAFPQPGAQWESYGAGARPGHYVRISGRVGEETADDGRVRLLFDEHPDVVGGAAGAPVVIENTLAAVMTSERDGASLLAIPVSALGGGQTTAPYPLSRLTENGQRAMAAADGLRRAMGQAAVDVPHLLVGLDEQPSSAARSLLREAGVGPERLDALVASTVERDVPHRGSYRPSRLGDMPPLSQTAEAALTVAGTEADRQGSPHVRMRHVLAGILSLTDHPIVRELIAMGIRPEDVPRHTAVERRGEIAGYRPDDPRGHDMLDIDREVEALCAMLAAKDVDPPISLGLFADWGGGKSFFMGRMEAEIARLAAEAKADDASPYCANVVQIRFNAWHYMDTDLWASLTSEIFERLDQALAATAPNGAALAATSLSMDLLADAQQRKLRAEAELAAQEKQLSELSQREASIDERLTDRELLRAAYREVVGDPAVKAELTKVAEALNMRSVETAAADAQAQLMELQGQWSSLRAFWMWLRTARRRWLLLLPVLVPLVGWAIATTMELGLQPAQEVIAATIAVLAGAGAAAKPIADAARPALAILQKAWASHESALAEARRSHEEQLRSEREQTQQRAEQARKSVESASQLVAQLQAQFDKLRFDRRVVEFVRGRHASADYTKHFGTVARARNDFEQLSELLDQARREATLPPADPPRPTIPRVDRIVLYIDDLDRCPEEKVVDVLQAVHLLLALPLFVVVVGVDPRWLLHSLRRGVAPLRNLPVEVDQTEDEAECWRTTPLNYLEKIFQIPFTLRPMAADGFGRLIDDLTEPPPEPAAAVPAGVSAARPAAPAGHGGGAARPPVDDQPGPPAVVPAPAVAARPPARVHARMLRLEEWERAGMKTVFRLIPSPRAAKRLVNVYRVMRTMVDPADRAVLVGDAFSGDYQAVLLLLAAQMGHPEAASQLLDDLLETKPSGEWWAYVDDLRGRKLKGGSADEVGDWRQLLDALAAVQPEATTLPPCPAFARWVPHVARYSFRSGQVLLGRTGDGPQGAAAAPRRAGAGRAAAAQAGSPRQPDEAGRGRGGAAAIKWREGSPRASR